MWKAQESHELTIHPWVIKKMNHHTLCNKGCQSSEICYLAWSVALRQFPGFHLDDTNGLICILINMDLSRPFVISARLMNNARISGLVPTTRNRTLNGKNVVTGCGVQVLPICSLHDQWKVISLDPSAVAAQFRRKATLNTTHREEFNLAHQAAEVATSHFHNKSRLTYWSCMQGVVGTCIRPKNPPRTGKLVAQP